MLRKRIASFALLTALCCLLALNQVFAQNKFFRMEVEQSVEPGKLNVDIYIQKTSGPDFALAACNFSLFVNQNYLNLPSTSIDFTKSGPWHVQTMPAHYESLSKGNGTNYVVLNTLHKTPDDKTLGAMVTSTRTRVGRLVIPVTDHSGFTTTTWRVAPTAVMKWETRTVEDPFNPGSGNMITEYIYSDIKSNGDYVNPAPDFPLCYKPAVPQLASGGTAVCPGESFELTSNYAGPHEWYRNGELIPSASENELVTTQPGTYTAVSMFYSCRSEVSQMVDLAYSTAETPELSAAGATQICASSSVTLNSNKSGTHIWYRNGQVITGSGNQLVANQAGTYTVVSVNGNCQSTASDPVTVSIVDNVNPNLSASSAGVICSGQTVTITSDFSGNHRWYQDNSLVQSSGTQLIVAQPGVYRAEAITDCNTQPATITIRTAVLETPEIAAAASEICQGEQITISSNRTGVHAWYRNGQSINGAGADFVATQPGTYTAVMMDGGCASSTSNAAVIAERSVAAPEVSASRTVSNGVVEVCENENLMLSSSVTGTHVWYQNGNIMTNTDSELLVTEEGIYRASSKDGNCISERSTAITVQITPQPVQPVIQATDNLLTTNAPGNLQWFHNGILIDGANTNMLVATQSGNYTVTATNDCGAATSDFVVVSLTNRDLAAEGVGFQAYPNPFVGKTGLYLTLDRSAEITLEVYNLLGARVAALQDGTLPAGTYTYEFGSRLQSVSAGTYTVVLRVNDVTATRKLIELER
ncbi:MAG: T9SS type A sorting domain-containing protein [Bacteroidetes bacterium]|nr:T9SS type A sorting domain-containing protein [Bacteroidota bacterium]